MDERTTRIFTGICLLVIVWIGVYWMWSPRQEQGPTITFDTEPLSIAEPEPSVPSGSDPDEPADNETSVDSADSSARPLPVIDPVVESGGSHPRVISPEFFDHLVEPGEKMQTIAKRYYGSIDDWTVISKANPKVDPKKLKVGTILRIPKDKHNIQGVLVGGETRPGVIAAHTGAGSDGTIEYIVQSGDSLSLISQRIYGTTRYAKFIFESNRDVLRSMDSISIGQLLKLPPAPEP
jgi:nucleoid-associated protein YgaU